MKLNTEQLNKLSAFAPKYFLEAAAKAHILAFNIKSDLETREPEVILSTFSTTISLYAQAIAGHKPSNEQEMKVYHFILEVMHSFSQLIKRFNDDNIGGIWKIVSENSNEENNEVKMYLRGAAEMLISSL